jgi:mono/diheme cytochrome c family protein
MSQQTAASVALFLVMMSSSNLASQSAAADDTATQNADGRLTQDEAKKLKSPVPFNKDSIARGRNLFIRDCKECHGADGKSQVDVVANATDLTEPKLWASGTSEGQIFRSIRDGAGDAMPPFKAKIENEKEIWHMVNFIRSLWPEAARPKLQETGDN